MSMSSRTFLAAIGAASVCTGGVWRCRTVPGLEMLHEVERRLHVLGPEGHCRMTLSQLVNSWRGECSFFGLKLDACTET